MTAPDLHEYLIQIFNSIVANAITTILAHIGESRSSAKERKLELAQKLRQDNSLQQAIQKAATTVAKKATAKKTPSTERLQEFLASPETEAFFCKLLSTRLISDSDTDSKLSREEFRHSLRLYLDLSDDYANRIAAEIHRDILICVDRALEIAVRRNSLWAHEAKSSYRQQRLLAQLESVKKNLALLNSHGKINVPEILNFEKRLSSRKTIVQSVCEA